MQNKCGTEQIKHTDLVPSGANESHKYYVEQAHKVTAEPLISVPTSGALGRRYKMDFDRV